MGPSLGLEKIIQLLMLGPSPALVADTTGCGAYIPSLTLVAGTQFTQVDPHSSWYSRIKVCSIPFRELWPLQLPMLGLPPVSSI